MSGPSRPAVPEERWEQGSEYHAMFGTPASAVHLHPWTDRAQYLGSGRDALRAVMAEGLTHRGWKRFWVPSFFCQEVVESILQVGLPIFPYASGPEEPHPVLEGVPLLPGDAVLRVNQFGLQSLQPLRGQRREGVEYVDDHTHDPWSQSAWNSDSDWCVASLRKTVPVPDGGVLWSPLAHRLPPDYPLSPERRLASAQKLSAMLLKDSYLRGENLEKKVFRLLAVEGEKGIGMGLPSGMSTWSRDLMENLPLAAWREQRKENHLRLSALLAGLPGARVLESQKDDQGCPYLVVMIFDHPEGRETLKRELVSNRIYPGTHWSLDKPAIDGIPANHLDLSRRILTIHCDMRYGEKDLDRVASTIRTTCETFLR